MTVTYLYRPDNGRIFLVVDYHLWRDTSATTAGFTPDKVVFVAKRQATEFEEQCYSQSWRMLSFSYKAFSVLEKDEIEFAGLDIKSVERLKQALIKAGCNVGQTALQFNCK